MTSRTPARTLAVFALFFAATVFAADRPATWTQWRGPNRDSQIEGVPWPDDLKESTLKQLWRVELAEGYPGPIVAEDRVFVAETKDKKEEIVRALDRKTGKQLWEAKWKGSLTVPFFALRNGSWIRSTPAYDGDCLYVAGIQDVLVCLDGQSGEERWRVDFKERYKTGNPAFGYVSSPLVDGDHVYVQAAGSVVKLEKKTGKSVWRAMEEGESAAYGSAFSSPILATVGGKRQLVVQSRPRLAGLDPETGKELWSQKITADQNMNIYTPILFEDGFFASTYGGGSFFFKLEKAGDKFNVSQAWTAKPQGYMSSPVVIDGHAYVHLRNQRFLCIELKTGKEKWITDEKFGQYWSMIAQKDRILALDQRGELLLIKANPEKFELLDRRKIAEQETWGHLAAAGNELFVRELKAVAAYRWGK